MDAGGRGGVYTLRMLGRALALLLLLTAALPALACIITISEPLKYAFKHAPIAFEGTLDRVDSEYRLHFTVHRQWKGAPVKTVIVPNDPSDCGYSGVFPGRVYVVVPGWDGTIDGGSHIRHGDRGVELAKTLDRRSRWWRCPLSSFTLYAIVRRIMA